MKADDGITDTSLITDILGGKAEVVCFVNINAGDSPKIAEPDSQDDFLKMSVCGKMRPTIR